MKIKGMNRAARTAASKALSVKKKSVQKQVKKKRRKNLKMKNIKSCSMQSVSRKKKAVVTPTVLSTVHTMDISSSSPCSSSNSTPFLRSPISCAPLIVDYPTAAAAAASSDILTRATVHETQNTAKSQPKRKRSTSVTPTRVLLTRNKDVQIFPVREWGLVVIVLPHPKTIKFLGTVQIEVISGSVNILGAVLEPDHTMVSAFSCSSLLCLNVKTESSNNICEQVSRLQIAKDALLAIKVPENLADEILNSCSKSSVILGFRKNFRSTDVHFANSLMPGAMSLKCKKMSVHSNYAENLKEFGFELCSEEDPKNLDFSHCENFITDILSSIQESDAQGIPAPRIVVQGNKNLGKSTFLRYVINRVLNKFDHVYYLDGDPGQSEFVPAGCVSLVKVTTPILGPPFTHQTTAEKMYFLGTVLIEEVADQYSTCVQFLSDYYKNNCFGIPLFVNTMGWMTGTGLKLLEQLKVCIQPTHLVKIVDDQLSGSHSKLRVPPGQPTNDSFAKEFVYQRFTSENKVKEGLHGAECRDLSILAYIGKCQKLTRSVRSFNSITPYCIAWKDVALYNHDSKSITEHILYSFCNSWVALLAVDDSLIMECDNPTWPKLLSEEPVGQDCYGFGVIRNIDAEKKIFYITTPEPLDRLMNVNALVKGSVQLPEVILTTQNMPGWVIPHNVQFLGDITDMDKHVTRRRYQPNRSLDQ